MQALVNRAIEGFVRGTYGDPFWQAVLRRSGVGGASFDALLDYDSQATRRVICGLAMALGKSQEEVLEDIGTFLVASPRMRPVRRLLRFGGVDFVEFLHSLNDLPARTRLALPELQVPQLILREQGGDRFFLRVASPAQAPHRYGHVMLGLLRAMADDYGALVFLEHHGGTDAEELIEVTLLEPRFATARDFSLSERPA
ncbi:MAG: heme NO-binding domain-containing protein [Roseovarius sp.]